MTPPDPSHPVLVHFYRAVVSHADVWRQRMDATTNWAAATTAGMVTFAFGERSAPHLVLLLAIGFDVVFLIMESRRYQIYDLWRRRFRTLNQYLVAPVLSPKDAPDAQRIEDALARVAADLGRTVPHLSLMDAVGYRIRRNYGYLFGVGIVAWLAKLDAQPVAVRSAGELVGRAAIGPMPGIIVMGLLAAAAVLFLVLGLRAPSEQMLNWTTVPSPADWLVSRAGRWIPGARSREGSQEPS